ncbi:MAG: hypothetical protein M5R36_00205 [Deltaproteobacteria bacterium]|nr:hypothetical protein [Deltaproteobacteria bacterium]
MEYGPRALGNRSVLYRTTDASVRDWLNRKLKRASYMPFAPVTLDSAAADCYGRMDRAADAGRFMTVSYDATDRMRGQSPGVVHLDGTVRPQILRRRDNPGMYRLLEEYHRLTGLPSLLNTSFNLHHEPIVADSQDACRSFVESDLDAMVMGPFLVTRKG